MMAFTAMDSVLRPSRNKGAACLAERVPQPARKAGAQCQSVTTM